MIIFLCKQIVLNKNVQTPLYHKDVKHMYVYYVVTSIENLNDLQDSNTYQHSIPS